MRTLTRGEALTVRSLLACESLSERERISRSGVAPRTFERARRKAHEEGWVVERYLPDFHRLGLPLLKFLLVKPFAERFEEVERAWKGDSSCVLIWKWPDSLFGVFAMRTSDAAGASALDPQEAYRLGIQLIADLTRAQVPVYLDFEASWSRFVGCDGSMSYPHTFPSWAAGTTDSAPISKDDRKRILDLVSGACKESESVTSFHSNPSFFRRADRHLFVSGALERRAFLDPSVIPPYEDRTLRHLAFIHGELVPLATPELLFRRLATIRVAPALFATDGMRILAMGVSPAQDIKRDEEGRPSVLGNLQQFLRNIEIERLPLDSMSVPVNHCYDRPFTSDDSTKP